MDQNPLNNKLDEKKIRKAVLLFLEAIGEDAERQGLLDTPDRVVRMSRELFSGMDEKAEEHLSKTFPTKSNGMVIEKNIRFYSLCEHHLLPFFGYVHIAYIPDGRVTGLSKLARCVDTYARRLQIQEDLTYEIMEAVDKALKPRGVMVMIEAEHMCMSMRGVKRESAKTLTTSACGCFEEEPSLRDAFLKAVEGA